jgi:serine/threonine protein kinase
MQSQDCAARLGLRRVHHASIAGRSHAFARTEREVDRVSDGQDAANRLGATGENWEGGSRVGRIGTVLRDKWRIDTRIGRGGMATVYAATHRNGNRVAIKMLHTEFSREGTVRARFLREAYVANGIGHRGTVRVLDDDIADDGAVFLVMDLLQGETLEARRVRCGGKLPLDEVLDVADELLDLLAVAHEKGVVHRDIKPENIFITEKGEIKVLDFGIARLRDQAQIEQTGTGVMLGTPDFMSPEQARGSADVNAQSDLWSTAATIFTLLSGDAVHSGHTLREHLDMTATQNARSLFEVARNVPARIVQIVDRALALEQRDRWSSARAMQQRLRAARGMPATLDDDDGDAESMTVVAASLHEASPSSEPISVGFDDTVLSSGAPDTTPKSRLPMTPESGPRSDEPTVMRPVPPEIAANGSFLRPILRQHQLDDDDPTPFSDDHQPRFQPRFGVQRGASTPPPPRSAAPSTSNMTDVAARPQAAAVANLEAYDPRRRDSEESAKTMGVSATERVPPNPEAAAGPKGFSTTKPKLPPLPVVIAASAIVLCVIAGILIFVFGR